VIGSGGRQPPYTWTAGSVAVPAGLQLTSDGNLAAKFSSAGSHLFDVVVTDATRKSARLPLRIDIEFAAALPPADALRFATSQIAIIRPQGVRARVSQFVGRVSLRRCGDREESSVRQSRASTLSGT
jgi:hypothetical protein